MSEARRFVEELDEASARMSSSQTLGVRMSWVVAADEMDPKADLAVPILSEDEPGLWVLCWAYPGERLILEVNHRGWVEWTHVTMTGHDKLWSVMQSGMGIPEERIRAFVRRRAKALGV